MEDFVSNLIKTSDLSVLTTKAVRKAYEAHIKQSLSKDEKDKLKLFVSGLLDEIAETLKVPFTTVPAEVQPPPVKTPQPNPESQKAEENVEKTKKQSNPLPQKPDNSEKTAPNSVSSNGLRDKSSGGADGVKEDQNSSQKLSSLKRKGRNDKSNVELDKEKDKKSEQPKEIVKKQNGKFKPESDSESFNETPTRKTSRRMNKKVNYVESDNESEGESVEMLSPVKRKLEIETKSAEVSNTNDSESDLPSLNEKPDSNEDSFVEETSISKPLKSPKKKPQKKKAPKKKSPVKRKKKMSLEDAVDNVLDSDKGLPSPVSSNIDIASIISSDAEMTEKTNKRKHVSSDEEMGLVIDEDLSPLQTKKTKTQTASVKPAAKRKKLLTKSEDIDSDDQYEPMNQANGKSVPVQRGKMSEVSSDDEPLSKSKKSEKLFNKKNLDIKEIDSEEDDKPLKSVKKAKPARKATKRKAAAKKIKIPDEGLESDSDNEPVRPKWKPTAKASPIPKKKTKAEINDSDNLSEVEVVKEALKPIKKRILAAPIVNDDSDIDEPLKPKSKPSAKASPIPKAKLEQEDGNVEDESPLKSRRNKTRKQIVESDSDGGFSESEEEPLKPTKSKKKKSPKRKPKKAKAQMIVEPLNHSDNEPPKPEPEKRPLILKIKKSDIKTVSESDEEPILQTQIPSKVGAKKNGFDSDSEGSDEDSLHIDLGVSNLSQKSYPPSKPQRNARKLARSAEVTDSESDLASMSSHLSSRAGSLSTRIETDLASEDSGVNVNLKSKKFESKKKSIHKSKKGSENKENRKGKRSVFSLSDTESDKNAQKRELFKAFKQRNISKLLCGESFDVKQCVIRLEKIDDQIDWTTKTSKVKVSANRKSSASNLDLSDSDDMSLKDIKLLETKRKQEFKSSTPVILRKVSKNWKVIIPPELESDSDFSDEPLKTVTNNSRNRSQLDFSSDFNVTPLKSSKSKKKRKRLRNEFLNSTFESDDLPLRPFQVHGTPSSYSKKKKKSSRRTLDSTIESKDLSLNVKPLIREDTDIDSSIPSPLPRKKLKSSSKSKGNIQTKKPQLEDTSDSENESLASLRRTKKLLDEEYEVISSHESSKAEIPICVTPRKWTTSCHNTPSKSTHIHDNTPAKSTRSHGNTPIKSSRSHDNSLGKSIDSCGVISGSEEGSDIGSLNDSIRSLEMLKPRKRESPAKAKRIKKAQNGQASPKKSASLPNVEIESDSDVSSIIEPVDDISLASEVKRSDSELASSKERESGQEASDPEDQANSEVSENSQSKKTVSELDSDDSGTSMDVDSPVSTKDTGKDDQMKKDKKELATLRKIGRAAGIQLRNKIELLGCNTDKEKISRIMKVFGSRGMTGIPSMGKARKFKIDTDSKKEAAELNKDNIISDSGRSKRKLKNEPPSPKKTVTPLKLKLKGLRGVIDSEGSESD